jgi:hypothetical protein
MRPRHLFAAILLAYSAGQYAFAEEPKKADAAQETQLQLPAQSSTEASAIASIKPATPVETTTPATTAASSSASTPESMQAASTPTAPEKAPVVTTQTAEPSFADSLVHEVKITDILLALFTGVLVVLGWIQARRMRETVAAAKESAAVAEKSARTAEEALVAGQRAFMFIREIKTFLHQDPETGKFHWTIHPVWANSGNTPTRGLSINTTYRLLDKPLPANYEFPESKENLIPTIAGPRSMVEASPGTLSSEDLEAVQQGKKFFYIWGWAEYHDMFEGTKKRVTRFCNQLIEIDGNPMMPVDERNPIQMMFGFHAENNYAD